MCIFARYFCLGELAFRVLTWSTHKHVTVKSLTKRPTHRRLEIEDLLKFL